VVPPPGLPADAATYGVMGKNGPAFYVSAETRKHIDQWSTDKVVLFGASWCTYCAAERKAFHERGIHYFEVDVDRDPEAMKFMTTVLGVPVASFTRVGNTLVYDWLPVRDRLTRDGDGWRGEGVVGGVSFCSFRLRRG